LVTFDNECYPYVEDTIYILNGLIQKFSETKNRLHMKVEIDSGSIEFAKIYKNLVKELDFSSLDHAIFSKIDILKFNLFATKLQIHREILRTNKDKTVQVCYPDVKMIANEVTNDTNVNLYLHSKSIIEDCENAVGFVELREICKQELMKDLLKNGVVEEGENVSDLSIESLFLIESEKKKQIIEKLGVQSIVSDSKN
jgi:hypothetical protein